MVDSKQLLYTCTYADGVEQRGTALEDVHRRADQRMSLLGQRPTGDGWTFDDTLDAYVRTVEDAYGRTLVGATVRATYVETPHTPDVVSAGEVVTTDTMTPDETVALVPLVSTSGEPLEVMAPGEPSWAAQVEAEATADLDPRDATPEQVQATIAEWVTAAIEEPPADVLTPEDVRGIVAQVDDMMATITRAEGVLSQMSEVDLLGDSPAPASVEDPYVWDAARARVVRQSELEPTPVAQVEVVDAPVPLAEYLPVVEEPPAPVVPEDLEFSAFSIIAEVPPAPVVPEVSDEAWLAQRMGQAILDERERMEQGAAAPAGNVPLGPWVWHEMGKRWTRTATALPAPDAPWTEQHGTRVVAVVHESSEGWGYEAGTWGNLSHGIAATLGDALVEADRRLRLLGYDVPGGEGPSAPEPLPVVEELVTVVHDENGHPVPFVYGTVGPLPSFEEVPAVEPKPEFKPSPATRRVTVTLQGHGAWAWTTADGDGWTYAGSCEEAQAAAEAAAYVTTTGEWQWAELPWAVLPDEVEEPLPMGMVSNSVTTGRPYIMVAPVSVLEDVGVEVDGVEHDVSRGTPVQSVNLAASSWKSVASILEEVPPVRRVPAPRRVGVPYHGCIEVTTADGELLVIPSFAVLGVLRPSADSHVLLVLGEGVAERLADVVMPDSAFLAVENEYEDILAALYERLPDAEEEDGEPAVSARIPVTRVTHSVRRPIVIEEE